MQVKLLQYQKEQVPPDSEKGQQIAKEFWGMIMEFTDGDMSMLPQFMDVGTVEDPNGQWQKKQMERLMKKLQNYIDKELEMRL